MSLGGTLAERLRTDHPLLLAFTFLEVIFLVLPSIIILVVSFGAGGTITFPPTSFTLDWYLSLGSQSAFRTAFVHSLLVATFCTVLAIPVGLLTAIGLNRYDLRYESGLQLYLLLPFTIPLVASGVILLILFGRIGWIGDLWAVGLALTVINIPFMIWSVSSSVNAFDPTLQNAAKSLGAEEIQTFLHITLPSLMPGVISGSLLMFMLALNEFVVSLIITTNQTVTLPVEIYSSIRGNISPQIAAVSSIYIIIAVVVIVVADRVIGLDRFLHS